MNNMLKSITSHLYGNSEIQTQYDGGYDLEEAIDRIIDGIDKKLCIVPGCHKKLRKDVAHALEYISKLVDEVPGPIEVSRKSYSNNPIVRSYFATTDVLSDTLNHGNELRTFFDHQGNESVSECCALLCANKEEKHVLGMALEDGIVRRDVSQTIVNIFDYKILSPATDDAGVRSGIKKCIFDGLITYALRHIAGIKTESRELTNRHRILHSQLRARRAHGNGLTQMLTQAYMELDQTLDLTEQLRKTEKQLKNLTGDIDIFSFYLEEIREIFSSPQKFIKLNKVKFRLSDMRVKVGEHEKQPANDVSFTEIEIPSVMKRIITIVRYSKYDISYNEHAFCE